MPTEKGTLQPYWVNASAADILKTVMARADASFREGLKRTIEGETTSAIVDPRVVFSDLDSSSTALWSLLLLSGYLTAERVTFEADGSVRCALRIPNAEIAGLYKRYIKEWFIGTMNAERYQAFLRSLVSGNVTEFEVMLRDYLARAMSFFDATGQEPEKFHHGLVLGMMVGLNDSHDVRSNRESGSGRYDVALIPKVAARYNLAVVLEFKQVRDPAALEAAASEALGQIQRKNYSSELRQDTVKRVLGIGLAFAGKEVAVAHGAIVG